MLYVFLMKRRAPRSTRTDTLLPYTTLVRSVARINQAVVEQTGSRSKRERFPVELIDDVLANHRQHLFVGLAHLLALLGPLLARDDVHHAGCLFAAHHRRARVRPREDEMRTEAAAAHAVVAGAERAARSEEHTSELQSLMRISYAVCCLKKNNNTPNKAV